jgi:hypothetical protein
MGKRTFKGMYFNEKAGTPRLRKVPAGRLT